jgi:hypothetical protein
VPVIGYKENKDDDDDDDDDTNLHPLITFIWKPF